VHRRAISIFRYAKRSAFGCNCRKRAPGAPRWGLGDKADFRFRIYALRRDALRLAQMIVRRGVDPDDDEMARLCRRVEWR
jgi:hypothetical protein